MTSADEVLAQGDAALAAVSSLAAADLSVLDESQLLSLIRTMEKVRRTAESFDNVAIPEVEARGIPARYVLRGTSQFGRGPAESGTG